ncbi:hypothetical protein Q8G35_18910 [Peribacillus simplex]|uniref:Uncharacterized protein n=2 Tax=Peribacillus TaxID=2675229 RepID=A0AA90PM36_9BACI|nr:MULTISPECIES: hypothetical protein [Peribacillus]MDP1420395.1 hypothetical protein [Peribacillus simplex]MDP1454810.1 hypothetical protein [Peribacillus frigoritolerans]
MDNTKKPLYIYGSFLLISWGLSFIIHQNTYTRYEIIEGMVFICLATIIYFILVHLNYRSELGKKIVFGILILIFIISCIGFYFSL